MGGVYPKGNEWNFNQDVDATKVFLEKWPTPIFFSGYEIGASIMTGKQLRVQTPETNPVRKAYQLYSGTQSDGTRNSWDLTAALFAVRGADEYWTLRSGGHVEIDAQGNDQWVTEPDRNHNYLIRKMRTTDLAKVLEDLLIQPPSSQCQNSDRLK